MDGSPRDGASLEQHCGEVCVLETPTWGVNPDDLRLFGPA